ncbi:glyoxalase [Stenotrophomonas koreensis]|uniref:Glyoxalase n=1 Tax=Stenotrophomonas koreensis TaxID=266128 RepID=A0A0R0BRA8_9GAMM|nr:VOC family protein [Stenotrophomonas koreensis]KRG59574.1 glyoxalase [Stenotrophomonas koreensis]
MSHPSHDKIHYVELPSRDLAATKAFFQKAFGWGFIDYGPQYAAITGAGLDGGFFQASTPAHSRNGSVLVVLYSDALEATQANVEAAGGVIEQAIFDFPGGRRFHFIEPGGSELAVWSATAT